MSITINRILLIGLSIMVPLQARNIIVKNSILPENLTYQHWTGTHTPQEFKITINDIDITHQSLLDMPLTDDQITMSYSYNFMNGMYKNTRNVVYTVEKNATDIEINFNWAQKSRIIVSNAALINRKSA